MSAMQPEMRHTFLFFSLTIAQGGVSVVIEPGTTDLADNDRVPESFQQVAHLTGPVDVTQTPSDGDFVTKTLIGDRTAFDQLIRRYQRQAVAVAFRLLGNSQDSLEVTQDAFLKAYKSLATLQKPEAFGGWLLRIVSNLSLNYRRSRKNRSKQLPLDDLLYPSDADHRPGSGNDWISRSGDPALEMEGRELGKKLQLALKQLPDKQRQAILMFTVDGLPQKDVAAALDCSVEAVKWHVFQGRKKLRELLKDQLTD
jgi:RNA polymerase sigma-70 factor (ECF subfamily)